MKAADKQKVNELRKENRKLKIELDETYKELSSNMSIYHRSEREKGIIQDHLSSLQDKERELTGLKNKLISEYFLNTSLERKRINNEIETKETVNTSVKEVVPFIMSELFQKATTTPQGYSTETLATQKKKF